MKKSDNKKRGFLLNFFKSGSILSFRNAISQITSRRLQFIFFDSERKVLFKKKIKYRIKAIPKKKIRLIKYAQNRFYLSMPVIQGDNIYGYILAFYLKHALDEGHINFIKAFIDLALKEFQREQELTKLYDTIRPRAIALSTIHTIHRLLSSTLDMDELIERIARLALQVMRAKYCSIMLLDDSRKYLIPKAVIDLTNNANRVNKKYRRTRVGARTCGKVVKTGESSLSHNSICVPLIEEDIIGVICAKNKTNNTPFNRFDLEILLTLAEQAVIAIKNAELYEEQKKMTYGSIKSLAALLDAKSPQMYTHSGQFIKIVLAIAEEMKLSRGEIRNLRYAALLPDTGKFSIPDEILKKRSGLSKKEYAIIKKQHLESLKILEPLVFLKPVMPIIAHHHERYDGTGYPDGLKGKQIPVGARIMAVADAFEAMVSLRPYKDSKISIRQAVKEIQKNKNTQFDPIAVDAFIAISKKPEFEKMYI